MRGKKCEILVKTDKNTRHKHRPQQQMNKHEYQVNVNITKFSTKREINYRNGNFLTVTPHEGTTGPAAVHPGPTPELKKGEGTGHTRCVKHAWPNR